MQRGQLPFILRLQYVAATVTIYKRNGVARPSCSETYDTSQLVSSDNTWVIQVRSPGRLLAVPSGSLLHTVVGLGRVVQQLLASGTVSIPTRAISLKFWYRGQSSMCQ
jgi:hypothetical protein